MESYNNMNWLFWKEYRQNRPILIAMFCIMTLPYVIFPSVILLCGIFHWPMDREMPHRFFSLQAAAWTSFYITQIVFSLLGAHMIASERIDLSSKFLDSLPIPRWNFLLCKILLAFMAGIIVWGINGSLTYFFHTASGGRDIHLYAMLVLGPLLTGVTFFCVSWMAASLCNSVIIGACIGLLTPLLVECIPWVYGSFRHMPELAIERIIYPTYISICICLCILCFVVGTCVFLFKRDA
jgi:ABC-type transport system involved in multi-copper enzyme maturation permease subunit